MVQVGVTIADHTTECGRREPRRIDHQVAEVDGGSVDAFDAVDDRPTPTEHRARRALDPRVGLPPLGCNSKRSSNMGSVWLRS